MKLKKRIACRLPNKISYGLLKNTVLINFDKEKSKVEIKLSEYVEITERQKTIMLNEAKSIFDEANFKENRINLVEELIFSMPDKNYSNKNNKSTDWINKNEDERIKEYKKPILLNKGIEVIEPRWNKATDDLELYYGSDICKSWFAKLISEIDEEKKNIRIKAPTNFIKDWIGSNYKYKIDYFIKEAFGDYTIVYC